MNLEKYKYLNSDIFGMKDISKSLYNWLNNDNGNILLSMLDKTWWIEKYSYCMYPSDKTMKELKKIIKEKYNAEYLYDKFPIKEK